MLSSCLLQLPEAINYEYFGTFRIANSTYSVGYSTNSALPLFLLRHKITLPTVKAGLSHPPVTHIETSQASREAVLPARPNISVLTVLRVALFIPAIDHLTYNVHSSPSAQSFHSTFRPFLALIQKLSAVKESTLNIWGFIVT